MSDELRGAISVDFPLRGEVDRRCLREFAHLAPGSVAVSTGQTVRAGEGIGRVGHTGNSTAPHLHFQLMDGPNPRTAKGVPCAFRELEVEGPDGWQRVENAIPRRRDRVRWTRPVEPTLDGSATMAPAQQSNEKEP